MPARILVVDDAVEVVEFLVRFLETLGYEASKAFDGYGAMVAFREQHADLILLDFAMPAGSGEDVYQQLSAMDTGQSVPIIFVSARPKYLLEQMLPKDPNVRFVEKPVDMDELTAHIAELLGPKAITPSKTPSAQGQ